MIITVRKTGGFAGIEESVVSLDTTNAPRKLKEKIEALLTSEKFHLLPEYVESEAEGFDFFVYEIMVKDNDKQHTVNFRDDGSEQSKHLLEFIDRLKEIG
jgi:2-phosphoglycerate kinase